jgi:hypothetical protein
MGWNLKERFDAIEPSVSQNVSTFAKAGVGAVASEVARRESAACGGGSECHEPLDPNGYWRLTVIAVVAAVSLALDDGVVPEYGTGHLMFLWFGMLKTEYLDLALPRTGSGMDDLAHVFAGICVSELKHLGYKVARDNVHDMVVRPKKVA